VQFLQSFDFGEAAGPAGRRPRTLNYSDRRMSCMLARRAIDIDVITLMSITGVLFRHAETHGRR
jgi:hypothetical protein